MDDDTPPTPAPAGSSPQKGFIERVTGILIRPKSEWGVIEGEASTVQSIYVPYLLILAAVGPIAMIIGQQLIGYGASASYNGYSVSVSAKPPIGYSVAQALLSYGLSLASVYVMALIIDALAPTFKGTKNFVNALKVAAYSMTAGWLAQIFFIVPRLAFLSIVGLYSFYLLYLGLPRLMKSPQDQSIGYVGVTVFAMIVVWGLVMVVAMQLAGAFFAPTVATVTYG